MTFQIAILGLDIIGTSIGLSLGEYKDKVTRIGHDRDPDRAKQAQKLGAVDRVENNLNQAIDACDLILLCEPNDESLADLRHMASDLVETRYLFDVGGTKSQFNEVLHEVAPDFKHHVNLYLTVNPAYLEETSVSPEKARADLFTGGLMFIATTPRSSSEAVELAETLASMLKTGMVFTDPVELDGLRAGVEQLPEIMGTSLMRMVSHQPGWRETRRLTDRAFFSTANTQYLNSQGKQPTSDYLYNRENIIRWIDLLSAELSTVKQMLQDGDLDQLDQWQTEALQGLIALQTQRQTGDWEDLPRTQVDLPNWSERLGKLLGIKKKK